MAWNPALSYGQVESRRFDSQIVNETLKILRSTVTQKPQRAEHTRRKVPVGREKEERMWRLAERMARSGKHASYMTIEWELTSLGYDQAHEMLSRVQVRERLDRLCREAKKGS